MLYDSSPVDDSSIVVALDPTSNTRLYKVSSEDHPDPVLIMANSSLMAMLMFERIFNRFSFITVEYVMSPGTLALIWAEGGLACLYVDEGKEVLTEIGETNYTDFKVDKRDDLGGVFLVSFDGLPYFVVDEVMGDLELVANLLS